MEEYIYINEKNIIFAVKIFHFRFLFRLILFVKHGIEEFIYFQHTVQFNKNFYS